MSAGAGDGRCAVRAIVLDFLLHAAIVAAIVGGLAYLTLQVDRQRAIVQGQVDRYHAEVSATVEEIRADLAAHRRYIAARDAAWAEAIGLPLPPPEPDPGPPPDADRPD